MPSGNLGLGLACGLGWVTSPIMLTWLLLPHSPHTLYSPSHTHPPPHLPSAYPSCNPSNPPVLIHPQPLHPSLTDFLCWSPLLLRLPLTLPGPWGATREEAVIKVPEHLGVWLASPPGPKLCRPSLQPPETHLWGPCPSPQSICHPSPPPWGCCLLWSFSEGPGRSGGSC